MIYIILKNIFNLNIGANIIICTTIYLAIFFLILTIEYKKVKYIKNTYLSNLQSCNNECEGLIIREDEILSEQKKGLIKKFKILFGICIGSITYIIFICFDKLQNHARYNNYTLGF